MILAALVAAQVKVTFVPAEGEGFGFAVNEVMVGGSPPMTVTVALAVADPWAFVAVMV